MTYGTHTTPIARYIDDIDFTFETQNDGSCFIKVMKKFFDILRMQSNNINLFRAIVNPKHFLCWILELIIAVSTTSILSFQKNFM